MTVDVKLQRGLVVKGVIRSQTGVPLEGASVNVSDAQGFLMDNMKGFFYGSADLAQIDTSKEGSIKW